MKGGTATKLLLEVIFSIVYNISFSIPLCSLAKEGHLTPIENSTFSITQTLRTLFEHYERTCRATYNKIDELAPLVELSGKSLRGEGNRTQGHVYYLAGSTLGLLAFIDASETVPTFGASYEEVRAFILDAKDENNKVLDAWSVLANEEGDLSSFGPQYTISQAFFEQTISPKIDEKDFVVLFYNSAEPYDYIFTYAVALKNAKANTKVAIIYFEANKTKNSERDAAFKVADIVVVLNHLPFSDILPGLPAFTEMSTKWILNAISTGGFVLQGKVFQNRMIDLGITNNKLYHRACGIISKFANVDLHTATLNLLRAIYSINPTSEVPSSILHAPISDHITKASHGNSKVVATAILLCNNFSVADAQHALASDPVVRNIMIKNGIGGKS